MKLDTGSSSCRHTSSGGGGGGGGTTKSQPACARHPAPCALGDFLSSVSVCHGRFVRRKQLAGKMVGDKAPTVCITHGMRAVPMAGESRPGLALSVKACRIGLRQDRRPTPSSRASVMV